MPRKVARKKRTDKKRRDNVDTIATTTTANTSATTTHPRKRQKTRAKGSSKRALKQSLSALPDMPIDILFEIFSHLTPLDLLNLSRTTKAFRSLLLDRRSVTVWRNARQRMCPRWPDLPADIAEPFWANLLFGKPVCEECGKKNAHKVIFELRRRVCVRCLEMKTTDASQFEKFFSDCETSVDDLVPGVQINGTKVYWESDVRNVLEALGYLQADIYDGNPEGGRILLNSTQVRRAYVTAVLDHASECEDALLRKDEEIEEIQEARFEEITERFVALGFEEEDVRYILSEVPMRTKSLTNRMFEALRKELEPRLLKVRKDNLELQYKNVREARRQIVFELYREYCDGLSPLERDYMPDLRGVYGFSDILAVVNSDHTLQVIREEFAEVMVKLPEMIQQWDAKLEDRLKNIETAKTIFANWTAIRLRHILDLNLAVFVVHCDWTHQWLGSYINGESPLSFGKREALVHLMHDRGGHVHTVEAPRDLTLAYIKFSQPGTTAVLSLIKLLKMDESEVTPDDLDEVDARFLCLVCHDHSPKHGGYRWIMNWRQAVAHFVESQTCVTGQSHSIPQWGHVVSDRKVRAIREVERRTSQDPATWIWRCNLCTELDRQSKTDLLEHIRGRHGVAEPVIGRDYFTDARAANSQKLIHQLLDNKDELSEEVRIFSWSNYLTGVEAFLYIDNAP